MTLHLRRLVVVAASAMLLTGCAAVLTAPEPATEAASPVPSEKLQQVTSGVSTVIDSGSGAQLCLGMILQSLPPQCGGPALVGWDWDDWAGEYEQSGDVRWGDFEVIGEYDADAFAFTPTQVAPRDEVQQTGEEISIADMFRTPCAEPAGGWRVLDESRATAEAYEQVLLRAQNLPDYSTSWVDRTRIPIDPDATPEEQVAETAAKPLEEIINVRVTGDVADAEAELRTIWGGMLCVTQGVHTEAELQAIADVEGPQLVHGLGWGVDGLAGAVDLQVVYDDGTLQAEMDAAYGEGVVTVVSALQPVD